MASAGETCTQCWVGALQLHEGMLVCDVCGSIHQACVAVLGRGGELGRRGAALGASVQTSSFTASRGMAALFT